MRQARIGCAAGCIPLVAMLSSTLGMARHGDLMIRRKCLFLVVINQQWQVILGTSTYLGLAIVFLIVQVLDGSSPNQTELTPLLGKGLTC